tara:strand:+ start:155 stop:508 length:354 start_codon:yes stop_codon:yes gene_type:complete
MLNNIGTLLSTKMFGRNIGKDDFNNTYYVSRNKKIKKRWVIYFQNNDASSIPPEWQAWLTYTSDELPNNNTLKYKWQIAHKANLTGLSNLYYKSNKPLEKDNKFYSSWIPGKKRKAH